MGGEKHLGKQTTAGTRLASLEEELIIGNGKALNEFWEEVQSIGAPIIEICNYDKNAVYITFIYREKLPIQNVVVFGSFPGYKYIENQLNRLTGTDLWFKTYEVRNDIRFSYSFSVNDSLDDNYVQRSKNKQIDKLNPNKITFIKDEEDEDSDLTEYSLVELPNVPAQMWLSEYKYCNKGNMKLHRFSCDSSISERRIWVYAPYNYEVIDQKCNLVVLMDGFAYINTLNAVNVLDNLIFEGKISPTICIFIDNKEDRYNELTCNAGFSEFIINELMPWILSNYNVYNDPTKTVIGGFSLSGLEAAFIGMNHSNIFGNVLCQSGSLWWENEWLIEEFNARPKLPLKFHLSVGILEDRPYDSKPIMMDNVIRFRDTLLNKGNIVCYEVFHSGHDYLSWGETLGNGLISLIGNKESTLWI